MACISCLNMLCLVKMENCKYYHIFLSFIHWRRISDAEQLLLGYKIEVHGQEKQPLKLEDKRKITKRKQHFVALFED